jgi:hypothetical protein
MCEKCVELDERIEHYGQLSRGITDRRTIDTIRSLIEKLRAEKTALHPEAEGALPWRTPINYEIAQADCSRWR